MCYVFLQTMDTPLHEATASGEVAAVELLLRYGAAINQTNNVS